MYTVGQLVKEPYFNRSENFLGQNETFWSNCYLNRKCIYFETDEKTSRHKNTNRIYQYCVITARSLIYLDWNCKQSIITLIFYVYFFFLINNWFWLSYFDILEYNPKIVCYWFLDEKVFFHSRTSGKLSSLMR